MIVMPTPRRGALLVAMLCLLPGAATSQDAKAKGKGKGKDTTTATVDARKAKTPGDSTVKLPNPRLFRSEEPLSITFTTNVKQIKKDKQADAPWRTATISYTDSAGKPVTITGKVKTRGIWRLKHCDYPPLRLNLAEKSTKGTIFDDLGEPKIVTFCRNTDQYEQWVLQEAQLYRVYQQLTPISHKMRLLRVTYTDSATGKVEATRYSFIIEDPKQVADRAGGGILKVKGAQPEDLDPEQTAIAFLFQYFIGNTDFSFSGLHNGEIVALRDGRNMPIPYDFDFAGVINANYAAPDPSLSIKTVRERLFRGYCAHASAYPAAFNLFRSKRAAIEGLYADPIGKLIWNGALKGSLAYFSDFYNEIKTDESGRKKIVADCLK
jgi:hypothetical protein